MDQSIVRMKQDLALAGYAKGTCDRYIYEIERLAKRFEPRPLDSLSQDEIRTHVAAVAAETDSTYRKVRLAAIKFLFAKTLGRPEVVAFISFWSRKSRVPDTLSIDEVERLFWAIDNDRYRTLAKVMYGAGLRISEAIGIQVGDIDSPRGVIRVRYGKGNKEREAKLSKSLYVELAATRPGRAFAWIAILFLASLRSPFAPGYVSFGLAWLATLQSVEVETWRGVVVAALYFLLLTLAPPLGIQGIVLYGIFISVSCMALSTWLLLRRIPEGATAQ